MISKKFLQNIHLDRFIQIENKQYSFKDLLQLVENYIYILKINNIAKNDKILILLDNSIEFIALFIASAELEVVMVPINYTQPKIENYIKKLDIKLIISKSSLRKDLSNYKNIIFIDKITNKYYEKLKGIISKNDYILAMTSGSTSEPKPIIFTQQTKIDRINLSIKNLYGISEKDTILVSTPIYHSLAQRLVLSALVLGANLVVLNNFSSKKFLQTIDDKKVTFTIAVSNQLESMIDLLDNYDLSSLKVLVSSSALLKKDIKKIYRDKFDNFHEIYGASEIGTATNLYPYDKNFESVGKALPYVNIKIIKNNKEVKPYEIGEIACKTLTIFKGYYNLDKLTQQSFYNKEYFLTGDLGYLDEKGFLYFKGRKKEVINVGGSLVFPKDVEKVIKEVKGVKEVAVIGIYDKYLGEVPLAVIVPNEEFNLINVKKKCLENLSDIQLPKKYDIVDELPKNEMGKVQKFKLKEKYKNLNIGERLKCIR